MAAPRESCICPTCGAKHARKREPMPPPERAALTAHEEAIFRAYADTDRAAHYVATEFGVTPARVHAIVKRERKRTPGVVIPRRAKTLKPDLTAAERVAFPIGATFSLSLWGDHYDLVRVLHHGKQYLTVQVISPTAYPEKRYVLPGVLGPPSLYTKAMRKKDQAQKQKDLAWKRRMSRAARPPQEE